jgi:hypothetical protein
LGTGIAVTAISLLAVLILFTSLEILQPTTVPIVRAQPSSPSATIAPSKEWGAFARTNTLKSYGDIQVNINKSGIAVRVEVPRDILQGVLQDGQDNATSFIQSDIRNDYYYYNVVDEKFHWTYAWNGTQSDGPCFKPNAAIYDPNAPWCVEIWNYFNGSFLNFTAPKFVRFVGLSAPQIAGIYNFTLFVADHTNQFGYPDFVHAWNTTLFVPVSMSNDPARIQGSICDDDDPSNVCPTIFAKGIAYAVNRQTGQISRAYINQTTGTFNLTGLAPGSYEVRASAGIYRGIAYLLSNAFYTPSISYNETLPGLRIHLKRAPQICGMIEYHNSLDPSNPLIRSVTDHPYLTKIGINTLNITVEATDPRGNVYRNQTVSLDQTQDSFKILTGVGEKYVGLNATRTGLNPYGTEYAGVLSSVPMTVRVWITGYLQKTIETTTVYPPSRGNLCFSVQPNPIVVESGGVITGTIQFWNLVTPETPHEAELSLGIGSVTDKLFGGNIVVQANDQLSGALNALEVINGTRADGKTIYANSTSVRFYLFGFSEYYNRTWAGQWNQKDCGLPVSPNAGYCLMPTLPPTYTITVHVRGYSQYQPVTVTMGNGVNQTINVRMIRGGAIQVEAFSFNNRYGTRAPQAELRWIFLNHTVPIKARIYFYDRAGHTVGFVERVMVQNVSNGVSESTMSVVFTGQSLTLRDIYWKPSEPPNLPTYLDPGIYSIDAYTVGYVQYEPVQTITDLASLSKASLILLIGDVIGLTGPVFAEPNLFTKITEHAQVIGEAYDSAGTTLKGAVIMNTTGPVPTLNLPIYGFGAIEQDGTLNGQGHFFYVTPDGMRLFDYGLENTTYVARIPELGFNKHFTTMTSSVSVTFGDLSLGHDVFLNVISMASVKQNGFITGWTQENTIVPLSWVQVEAWNQSYQRTTVTLDGRFDGAEALFLPAGTYNINFTVAFFKTQTTSLAVFWNNNYSLTIEPLCPTNGIAGICDPPANPTRPQSIETPILVLTAILMVRNDKEGTSIIKYNKSVMRSCCNHFAGESAL